MGGGEGNGSPTGTSCPRTDRHSTCQSLLWTFPLFESELQSLTSAAAAGALRGRGRPPEPPLFGAFPPSHVSEAFSESCGRPRNARGNIFWCVSHGGVERLDRAGAFGGEPHWGGAAGRSSSGPARRTPPGDPEDLLVPVASDIRARDPVRLGVPSSWRIPGQQVRWPRDLGPQSTGNTGLSRTD